MAFLGGISCCGWFGGGVVSGRGFRAVSGRRPRFLVQMVVDGANVERTRLHRLTTKAAPKASEVEGKEAFVLYWMQNSARSKHSPALEHAAELAATLKVPLRAVHAFDVIAQDDQPLTERHAYFLLETLADVQKTLAEERQISLVVTEPTTSPEAAVKAVAELGASAVVTDVSYLRRGRQLRSRLAKLLNKTHVVAVEGDIVVPVEEVTNKVEHAARTIRPKIHAKWDEYTKFALHPVNLPAQDKKLDASWLSDTELKPMDLGDLTKSVAKFADKLDGGAPRVPSDIFRGGETVAQETLRAFLDKKLFDYAAGRNEPVKGLQSNLSPYLRVGAISPVDITLQTKAHVRAKPSKQIKEGRDSFLEELIVRRELGMNMCWFDVDGYDKYLQTVPNYAQESLELHKSDARPVIHTYEELEAALTDDEYWNAAQEELLLTGKMHGYLRMYWAKRIIMWTESAEVALDYCLRLNNRWELDAVDPNSYAGVVWNFGRHDQGWTERSIYGKVRFMNESGLKRKFNMAAYVSKVGRLRGKLGLPSAIEARRRQAKRGGGGKRRAQVSLDSFVRKDPKSSKTER